MEGRKAEEEQFEVGEGEVEGEDQGGVALNQGQLSGAWLGMIVDDQVEDEAKSYQ